MTRSTSTRLRSTWHRRLLVCALIAGTAAGQPLLAATVVVGNLSDSGVGSLRQAIAAANPGDTIAFAPGLTGTIPLGSSLVIDRSLIIEGNPGIVLDGGNSVRVLMVNSAVQANLNHLAIQRGLANDGGGIHSLGTLTLNDCTVRDNHATDRGGGIFIGGGNLALIDSQVIDNEAVAEGGGIDDLGSSASYIIGSNISGNISQGPGAGVRHASGQPLSISYSTIAGNQIANTGTVTGGGIASQGSTLDISYSSIVANKAHFAGGIYIAFPPSVLNLTASLVAGNTAVSDGGGMFAFGATANVLNSTIANNLAGAGTGGGIGIQNSSGGTAAVRLVHTTVASNRAGANGGGIALISGGLTLKNTLIGGNIAPTNTDLNAAFTSQGYNLVQTRGTSTGYVATDLANGTAPNLGTLTFNGGPTNTLRPLTGSAAINAIAAAGCNGSNLDQRGYTRPAASCDIGAFEVEGVMLPDAVFAADFE